jgi:FkbM family methyltransferase
MSATEIARNAADGLLRYAPDGLRKSVFRARRARSRRLRSTLEARGDFSRSHTAIYGLETFLEQQLDTGPGVFVEAGAADGVFQSNTYWFERRWNWTGVLVEPVPELAREATLSRPGSKVFQCALVSDGFDDASLVVDYAGAMTHVSGLQHDLPRVPDGRGERIVVPARTLTSVLDEAGISAIDLLSLDVEGYEGPALEGLDLERFCPRFMLIEIGHDAARAADVERAIGHAYEMVARPSPIDVFYRARAGRQ